MQFQELALKGAYLIQLAPNFDERGFFSRQFCQNEFKKMNLEWNFVQVSIAFNKYRDQIRGMHFQEEPYSETKLVRCLRGKIYDVIIDLRKNSPTYKKSYGIELSSDNHKLLYIPKGFAHGYKTLEDNTELLYMMDAFYKPEAAREIPPDITLFKQQGS